MVLHAGTIRMAREDFDLCGYKIQKGWYLNVRLRSSFASENTSAKDHHSFCLSCCSFRHHDCGTRSMIKTRLSLLLVSFL